MPHASASSEGAPSAPRAKIEEQIAWYNRAASRAQWQFRAFKLLTLAAAAAIPVLALTPKVPPLVIAVLGAMVALAEGVQQLFRYHELWLTYRATAESLTRELLLHDAAAGPYDPAALAGRAPLALLVERSTGLMEQESTRWQAAVQRAAAAGAPEQGGMLAEPG